MRRKVKVAIAGVGNCASALVQGTRYYRDNSEAKKPEKDWIGLTAYNLGGLEPSDIEFVAAFDVNALKVGKDLSEAIFAKPNNTIKIIKDMDKMDVRSKRERPKTVSAVILRKRSKSPTGLPSTSRRY